ncbi:MAG: hypothetical protein CL579_17730 [Alteromonadaceae bacterium]|nr:hypothetical protein [Alteromonadaceae bacterium]
MSSLASITVKITKSNGEISGQGWLISNKKIVTCAHVINHSLNRKECCDVKPTEKDLVTVHYRSSPNSIEMEKVICKVAKWLEPKKNEQGFYSGDVAVLVPCSQGIELEHDILQVWSEPIAKKYFSTLAFLPTHGRGLSYDGVVGELIGDRFELKPNSLEKAPRQGYSGSPVISNKKVIGIVGSTNKDGKVAYAIPVSAFYGVNIDLIQETKAEQHFDHMKLLLRKLKSKDQRNEASEFELRLNERTNTSLSFINMTVPQLDNYGPNDLTAKQFYSGLQYPSLIRIAASGGSGKSHFLLDLVRNLAHSDCAVFWLNLAKTPNDFEDYEKLFDETALNSKFEELNIIKKSKPSAQIYVIADGLNEKQTNKRKVLGFLEKLYNQRSVTVIVGDRLSENLESSEFKQYTMAPLSKSIIASSLNSSSADEILDTNWEKLLSSPFFLSIYINLSLEKKTHAQYRHELMREYFLNHVFTGNKSDETKNKSILAAAKVAYNMYKEHKSPIALEDKWNEAGLDNELMDLLKESGTLIKDDKDYLGFQHQLFHDWLAALHVAENNKLWEKKHFDYISIKKLSIESIIFASEITQKSGKITDFLVALYDWDYRYVLRILADFDSKFDAIPNHIELEFRDAIFALNALRASDIFEHTRQGIKEYLDCYELMGNSLEINFDSSPDEIICAYKKRYAYKPLTNGRMGKFRSVFLSDKIDTLKENEQITLMNALLEDPVIGWTASNILRLQTLTSENVLYIIAIFNSMHVYDIKNKQSIIGIRWRIVHLLGSASRHNLARDKLLEVLFDKEEYEWVRFGAARSLMEQASSTKSTEICSEIINQITRNFSNIDSRLIRAEILNTTKLASGVSSSSKLKDLVFELVKNGYECLESVSSSEKKNWGKRLNELNS